MSELTEALERIRLWQQLHHPDLAVALQPGLSDAEIEDYLKDFPYQLSQEVYELYNWRNGCEERTTGNFPLVRIFAARESDRRVQGKQPRSEETGLQPGSDQSKQRQLPFK